MHGFERTEEVFKWLPPILSSEDGAAGASNQSHSSHFPHTQRRWKEREKKAAAVLGEGEGRGEEERSHQPSFAGGERIGCEERGRMLL